jgi:hypothetical protein
LPAIGDMPLRLVLFAGILLAGPRPSRAQARPGVTAVAVIVNIHSDSSGQAIQGGRRLDTAAVNHLLQELRSQRGATVWFSWSGGPEHRRTRDQEALLARLRESGVRVELRSDSTMHSRVIRKAMREELWRGVKLAPLRKSRRARRLQNPYPRRKVRRRLFRRRKTPAS